MTMTPTTTRVTQCPTEDELYWFVSGRTEAAGLGEIDAHLDICNSCRHAVVALGSGPPRHADAGSLAVASATTVLKAGAIVGSFVIDKVLGEGAMGIVYKAHDQKLGRAVAIKVLRNDDPLLARTSIIDEARHLATLAHPNIVAVYEVGSHHGQAFIVMEFVDGPTLRTWAQLAPSESAKRRVLAEIADALSAVHARGMLHRDVKPDNVLIGADGRARLVDVGLAKKSESELQAVHVPCGAQVATGFAGTPAYMSPEVANGSAATVASELYSLAVTCCEVLFGDRATTVPANADRKLTLALQRALQPDPRHRGTIAELGRALTPPLPTQKRIWLTVSLLALAATVGVAAYAMRSAPTTACRNLTPEPAAAWLAAGANGHASPTLESLRAALTVWSLNEIEARTAICRATHVARTQSPALLDVKMRCLADQTANLRALATLSVGAGNLDALQTALATMPPPAECVAWQDVAPQESEIELAPKRKIFNDLLVAVSSASYKSGDEQMLATALATSTDARFVIASHLLLAEAQRNIAAYATADEHALQAIVQSENHDLDGLAAEAWTARLAIAGEQADLQTGRHWLPLAEAAVAKVASNQRLTAKFQHTAGVFLLGQRKLDEAEGKLRTAMALRTALANGKPTIELASTHSAMGQLARLRGNLSDAEIHQRTALRIDTELFGSAHETVTRDQHNLAGVLRLQNRLDEAKELYQQSLASRITVLGPTHPWVAQTKNSLGLIALTQADTALAIELFTAAKAGFAAHQHGDEALSTENLGRAQLASGDVTHALVSFDDAAKLFARYVAANPGGAQTPTYVQQLQALAAVRQQAERQRDVIRGAAPRRPRQPPVERGPTTENTGSARAPNAAPASPPTKPPTSDLTYGSTPSWH